MKKLNEWTIDAELRDHFFFSYPKAKEKNMLRKNHETTYLQNSSKSIFWKIYIQREIRAD